MKTKNNLKIFNDPIYGFITIPNSFIFDLIESPYFQRLRRISQMGLSYLVYPGAHHTRFHHALGSLHLMQNAVRILKFQMMKKMLCIQPFYCTTLAMVHSVMPLKIV